MNRQARAESREILQCEKFFRSRRSRGVHATGERLAIVNEKVRRLVPREGLTDLLRHRRRRWVLRGRDARDAPRVASITSTNSSRPVAVGITKTSAAMICPTWLAKNVRHGRDAAVEGGSCTSRLWR